MADLLDSVVTFLGDNWNSTSTDSKTPTFNIINDVKRIDLNIAGQQDVILLYERDQIEKDQASGGGSKHVNHTIIVDLRTTLSRAHAVKIREEIRRIFLSNEVDPFGDGSYDIVDATNFTDLSEKTVKLWRWQIRVEFQTFNRQ